MNDDAAGCAGCLAIIVGIVILKAIVEAVSNFVSNVVSWAEGVVASVVNFVATLVEISLYVALAIGVFCLAIGTLHILLLLVKTVLQKTERHRNSLRQREKPAAFPAGPIRLEADKVLTSMQDMIIAVMFGALATACGGALLGLAVSIVRGEDIIAALLAAGLSGGIIGAIGAGVGSAIGDNNTATVSALGAVTGALLGAIGGQALGADAWLSESIAAIDNESIMEFLTSFVQIVGGAGTTAGIVFGIFTSIAIDTFRGHEAMYVSLVVLGILAVVGALVAGMSGGDESAGAAVGGFVGAILGALIGAESAGAPQEDGAQSH
ncbi:MAG: hypothetical protein OXI77_07020 [Chloroflexota bacterium]|nr:hypothetical protein [Chloroflexota bacterium]MDE2910266.1 hypothetical protein [Chloroflexota bacterium]